MVKSNLNTKPLDTMKTLEQLKADKEAAKIAYARGCEQIMANPESSEEDFEAAFQARDIAYVEDKMDGMTEDERQDYEAELRWETGCGCNGADSPYHTYFGWN